MNVRMTKTKCGKTRRSQFATFYLAAMSHYDIMSNFIESVDAFDSDSIAHITQSETIGLCPKFFGKSSDGALAPCRLIGYLWYMEAILLRTGWGKIA